MSCVFTTVAGSSRAATKVLSNAAFSNRAGSSGSRATGKTQRGRELGIGNWSIKFAGASRKTGKYSN